MLHQAEKGSLRSSNTELLNSCGCSVLVDVFISKTLPSDAVFTGFVWQVFFRDLARNSYVDC